MENRYPHAIISKLKKKLFWGVILWRAFALVRRLRKVRFWTQACSGKDLRQKLSKHWPVNTCPFLPFPSVWPALSRLHPHPRATVQPTGLPASLRWISVIKKRSGKRRRRRSLAKYVLTSSSPSFIFSQSTNTELTSMRVFRKREKIRHFGWNQTQRPVRLWVFIYSAFSSSCYPLFGLILSNYSCCSTLGLLGAAGPLFAQVNVHSLAISMSAHAGASSFAKLPGTTWQTDHSHWRKD